MVKCVTCVICPVGCEISVDVEEKDNQYTVKEVTGNRCQRGFKYASAEATYPERLVTSTVEVIPFEGALSLRVPVKTSSPVPKGKIFQCIKEIKQLKAKQGMKMGDILLEGVAGTDANIVLAMDVG